MSRPWSSENPRDSDQRGGIDHPFAETIAAVSFPPHSLPPAELAQLRAAERAATTFVAFKDGTDTLQIEPLLDAERMTIGRGEHNWLALVWDPEASRTHAQLELIGGDWTVVDEGLSRNGTFVNGDRVSGRRRLGDGDMLRVGRTAILFRTPTVSGETTITAERAALVRLSEAQHRVLVELCRPAATGGPPATNRQIGDALHLTQDGVKAHIRTLFAKLGIEELPQYQKRTELARRALDVGLVSARDLRS
jgi:pSer/pThr/pTyr-binding forkhead associated (FHA) protein